MYTCYKLFDKSGKMDKFKNLSKSIKIILLTLIIVLVTFLVVFFSERITSPLEEQYSKITDVTITYNDIEVEKSLPTSIKTNSPYSIELDLKYYTEQSDISFMTATHYVNFYVYLDNKLYYSYNIPENSIVKSGGSTMHDINLPINTAARKIKFEYIPTVKNLPTFNVDTIYVGQKSNIILDQLIHDLPSLLFSIAIIFIFIVLLITTAVQYKLSKKSNDKFIFITMLGALIGVYLLTQLFTVQYIMRTYPLRIYFIEFSTLTLLPFPALMIFKNRLDKRFDKIYTFLVYFIPFYLLFQYTILFFFDIEMKLLLPFTQFMIIASVSFIVYTIINSDKEKYPERDTLLLTFIPIFIVTIIIMIFYLIKGIFLFKEFFIIIICIFIGVQIKTLINNYINFQNEKLKNIIYKEIAYTDSLTKLQNRTAYNEFLKKFNKNKQSGFVISIDLDGLKKMNDNYGHQFGDAMIKIFSDYLKLITADDTDFQAFRIGGDEFFIFAKKEKSFDIENWLQPLRQNFRHANIAPDYNTGQSFSAGYFYYNCQNNEDISNAIHLADQKMYAEKFNNKKGRI